MPGPVSAKRSCTNSLPAFSTFVALICTLSASGHRLNSVRKNIEEAGLDQTRVELKSGQGIRPVDANLDRLPRDCCSASDTRFVQGPAQIAGRKRRGLLPAGGEKVAHEMIEPRDFVLDVREIPCNAVALAQGAIEVFGANLVNRQVDEVQ